MVLQFFSSGGGQTGKQANISDNCPSMSTVHRENSFQTQLPTLCEFDKRIEEARFLSYILIPAVEMALCTVDANFGVCVSFIVPQGEAHRVAASRWACQVILATQQGATFCEVTRT